MKIPLSADYLSEAGLTVTRGGGTIYLEVDVDRLDVDFVWLTVDASKRVREALERAELDAAIYRVHGSAGCPGDARPDAPAVVEKEGTVNRWECDVNGCRNSAVGTGGAIGLLAIGWYFRPGPMILCPEHRPDAVACDDRGSEIAGQPCKLCAAEHEAKAWQILMQETLTHVAEHGADRTGGGK